MTDGIESAVSQALEAAGGKDVQVNGGASVVRQAIEADLLDDIQLHLAPALLGDGVRLFDGLENAPELELEGTRVVDSPEVTHLRYSIKR